MKGTSVVRLVMLAVLTTALTACGLSNTPADPTPTPTPGPGTISEVYPNTMFLGRTAELVIAGEGTQWDANTTVALGDGVTVTSVDIMGPGALRVMVATDPMGAAGPRDLTVSAAVGDSRLDGALTLSSPIEVSLQGGTEQAGSVNFYSVINLDLDNPFTETLAMNITASTGAEMLGGYAMSPEEGLLVVYYDLYAEHSAWSVTTDDNGLMSYQADIAAGSPTTIDTIDPAVGFNPTLAQPGEVAVGRLDMTAGTVMKLDISAEGASPVLMLFDTKSGAFGANKMFTLTDRPLYLGAEEDGSYVIVLHDGQLLAGDPLAPGAVVSAMTPEVLPMVIELEPNDTKAEAQLITEFPTMVVVEHGTPGDRDWLSGDLSSFSIDATYVRAISMPAINNGLALSDSYMSMYEDDTLVTQNDDLNAYFAGVSTFLVGTMGYLEASTSPQYAPDDTGRHIIAIWAEAATTATELEPNDDRANGSALGLAPGLGDGAINVAGDGDFYSLTLLEDGHVTIETMGRGDNTLSMSDTAIELYDENDTLLADNDDKGFFDFWSMIEMDLTAGTYWVKVMSSPQYAPDDTGDYRVTLIVE